MKGCPAEIHIFRQKKLNTLIVFWLIEQSKQAEQPMQVFCLLYTIKQLADNEDKISTIQLFLASVKYYYVYEESQNKLIFLFFIYSIFVCCVRIFGYVLFVCNI